MNTQPGPIVLLGSGETSPGAHKVYHRLFTQLRAKAESLGSTDRAIRIAILETPAGFQPNSAEVAGQIAAYFEHRLQNFQPRVQLIPARGRGTAFSPDDAALAAQLYAADVIFMGPGSPTYAVRQLRESVVWDTVRACHRLGAALIFASAATLAISRLTIPVYEIYKAGEDPHWKPGLDFFGDFGWSAIMVSHWNNTDGGQTLDTSRCYIGQSRFMTLLDLAPKLVAESTVVGIDENTGLVLDPAAQTGQVIGPGGVTLMRGKKTTTYAPGHVFALGDLADFCLHEPSHGIPLAIWRQTEQGRSQAAALAAPGHTPEADVLALLDQRQDARLRKDWRASDQLREQIAARGWRGSDTQEGQVLEPEGDRV